MPFFETRVRVQHPCKFCDLSVDFPEAQMALWCNFSGEVVHVECPDSKYKDQVLAAINERLSVEGTFEEGADTFTITRRCQCTREGSVYGVAEQVGLWILHPILITGGWETYRLVAPGQEELRDFVARVQKLGKIVILSHRVRDWLPELHNVDASGAHLFDGLTDRQLRALILAHEHGLLNVPSDVGLDDVAKREGLARSTFGEHLRKAQQRLLANAYPFLKLQAGPQAPRAARRRAGESEEVGGK